MAEKKAFKFLHTADWHIGKTLHGNSLIEEQESILKQVTEIAVREKVDAVIIAGDLYDKPIPSIEATKLLEQTLYELNVKHGLPVLAISGNHDSASRLSFGSAWYEKSNLHVIGGLQNQLQQVTLGDVQFWLIPYHDVQTARAVFENRLLKNVDDAMRFIIDLINKQKDPSKKQVMVSHSFVAGGLMSDSERSLSVGNVERISLPTFAAFDYVALGHLHNPHAVNDEKIHYSGSPLKYSFSEVNQEKGVKIVELGEETNISWHPLQPTRDVRVLEGMLSDLLEHPIGNRDDYLKVTLLDEGALVDPIGNLRTVYPNVLHLERKTHKQKRTDRANFSKLQTQSELDVFEAFFEFANGKEMVDTQKQMMAALIDDLKRGEQK